MVNGVEKGVNKQMLRACVIIKNERVKSHGDLLAISRSVAKTVEHSKSNIAIKAIIYVPEFDVHLAIYEKPMKHKGFKASDARGKEKGKVRVKQ